VINSLKKNIAARDYFFLNYLFKFIRHILGLKNNNENKIIVISFKLLGDTVFTIPAIKYLMKNSPGKEIVIFCFEDNKSIYELLSPEITYEIFPKDKINLDSPFIRLSILQRIWKHKPGNIVDFTSGVFIALTLLLSRSKKNTGFNLPIFRQIYDCFVLKRNKSHLMDMYMEPVKKYFNQEEIQAEYIFPAKVKEEGTLLICPSAGWKAKEWGVKKFLELGLKLKMDYQIKFVFMKDSIHKDIEQEFKNEEIDIVYTKNINELINEIKNAVLVISNDSGPIYIANLLGKPTFTIYGPTNPKFSLPFGPYHSYIQKKIICSPEIDKQYCFRNAGRTCKTIDCMNLLTVEEVSAKLYDFIVLLGLKMLK
jgi:ADP-heptose:LPS heptosyltransferase